MKNLLLLVAFLITSWAAALDTVPSVDLNRYLGTWYEIASYPMFFQRGCVATEANYQLRPDGRVTVLNKCRKNSLTGPWKTAEGIAKVVESTSNAKLKVKFFLFWGDYWIIDLGSDYEYAVVSEPRQKYLWILSRTRQMDKDLFQDICKRLEEKGFDLERLQMTLQPAG